MLPVKKMISLKNLIYIGEKEVASKLCPVCLTFADCGGELGRMPMERGKAAVVYLEMHVNSCSRVKDVLLAPKQPETASEKMLLRISAFSCESVQKMTLGHRLLLGPGPGCGYFLEESEKTGLRGTPRGLLLPPSTPR